MNYCSNPTRRLPMPALTIAVLAVVVAVSWSTAAAQTIGFHDFSYANSNGLSAPTGSKPESKIWFNDNSWWAVMFNSVTARHRHLQTGFGDPEMDRHRHSGR